MSSIFDARLLVINFVYECTEIYYLFLNMFHFVLNVYKVIW